MNVSVKIMETRLEGLKTQREKQIGELNMLQGRIVETEAILAHLKAEEPKAEEAEA